MNPIVKQVLLFGLEFVISHEASLAAHRSPEVQKLGADAVAAIKLLLPVLQAA